MPSYQPTDPIRPGQIFALQKLLREVCDSSKGRHYILEQLTGESEYEDLSLADWWKIRDSAYPNWHEEDWTIGKQFRAECADLFENYLEDELGQLRMFDDE